MRLFPQQSGLGPFDHFSLCGRYRYELGDIWSDAPPLVAIGINPSTARNGQHDNTSRRVEGFAVDSGAGGWAILNPFAWCDKDARVLTTVADPIGPENDDYLRRWALRGTLVIAWGPPIKVPRALRWRFDAVLAMFRDVGAQMHVLWLTKDGYPGHPLMLPGSLRPVRWVP